MRLSIWLRPDLPNKASLLDEFIISPHKYSVYDGYSRKKGGGGALRDAVLAHERGHAKAFFQHQKAIFESEIASLLPKAKLSDGEKKTIEKAYKQSAKAVVGQSIEYSNEGMKKWFVDNGFIYTERGGIYVFRRKK